MVHYNKFLIGWQEWCSLPELNIKYIKAKIDTGARTSALHAYNIKEFSRNGIKVLRFDIYPLQGSQDTIIKAEARVLDKRYVMSSNGHKENRYVILTPLELNGFTWDIQLTLSNRDPLRFRMLLGREALSRHCIIDPSRSNCLPHLSLKSVVKYYNFSR